MDWLSMLPKAIIPNPPPTRRNASLLVTGLPLFW
jgi:hypothetical protein